MADNGDADPSREDVPAVEATLGEKSGASPTLTSEEPVGDEQLAPSAQETSDALAQLSLDAVARTSCELSRSTTATSHAASVPQSAGLQSTSALIALCRGLKESVETATGADQSHPAFEMIGGIVSTAEEMAARQRSWEGKLHDLEQDLRLQQQQLTHANQAEDELQMVAGELAEAKEEAARIQASVSQLHREQDRLELARQDASKQLVNTDLIEDTKEQQDKLNVIVTTLTSQITKLVREQERLAAEKADFAESVANLQAVNIGVQEKVALFEKEHKSVAYVPDRIRKQASVVHSSMTLTDAKLANAIAEEQQIQGELDRLTQLTVSLEDEREKRQSTIADLQHEISSLNRKQQQILKQMDQYKDALASILGDRASSASALSQQTKEAKLLQGQIARLQREKELGLRNLKTSEIKQQKLKESVDILTRDASQLRTEKSALTQQTVEFGEILIKVTSDLDAQRKDWESQITVTKDAAATVAAAQLINRNMEKTLAQCVQEHRDNLRKVNALQQAVDASSGERVRCAAMSLKAADQLKSIQLAAKDQEKTLGITLKRLKDVQAMYNIVKNEKSMCINQIGQAKQRQLEMRDKMRIMTTELEILHTSVEDKAQLLHQCNADKAAYLLVNDALRGELNGVQLTIDATKTQSAHEMMEKQRLVDLINSMEWSVKQAQTKLSEISKQRNALASRTLRCLDDVALHQSVLSVQQETNTHGEVTIHSLNEQIRFLEMEKKNLHGKLKHLSQESSRTRDLQAQLVDLRSELGRVQMQVIDLEQQLTDPMNASRKKAPSSKTVDPSIAELELKLLDVGDRLDMKEERSLNLDVAIHDAEKLCERVQVQMSRGKDDCAAVTKTVSTYQRTLKQLKKKLMAAMSELAMYQTEAHELSTRSEELAQELEEQQYRMSVGEAPSEAIEAEWKRLEGRLESEAKQKGSDKRRVVDEDADARPEPRANAYIPDANGALPIPKPFGPHPPFQASLPGANIRHFKRSVKS
eukprot:m.130039 g.130039  ORF g.130039 m.130039 type:complete len:992 (-) comp13896_c2_seq6:2751-5726(-)